MATPSCSVVRRHSRPAAQALCRRSASSTSTSPQPPTLYTQLLLHRRPYLTPPAQPLVDAVHSYNQRLARALAAPLPSTLYFKKGSLAARRFAHEEQVAQRDAFGIKPSAADEVEAVDRDSAVSEVLPRGDRADGSKQGDASVERKGDRSLYLLVQAKDGSWRFPGAGIEVEAKPKEAGEENVRGLAARAQANAVAQLGPNLSLWPVGRFPIAHVPSSSDPSPETQTFVFKSHLLAGYPVLTALAKKDGWRSFAFLTKEEIGERVLASDKDADRAWWTAVEPLLNTY